MKPSHLNPTERKAKTHMIRKDFKGRLHENLIGTHISMPDSIVSEMLGRLGYDFVWIDTEHSEMTYTNLRNHLTAVNAGGTPTLVRLSMHDYNHVKRVMEMGPDAILFPMINTPEEAAAAMSYCMYPPEGMRGFGPLRAVNYGLDDMNEYIAAANRDTCRFIQIETETAVKNLPEIVKNPYIDGYFFGPCDLSGTIGKLNQVFGERTQKLIREAIAILKDAGKPIGVSTGSIDPEVTGFWHDLGINIISTGTDYDYILQGARQNLANMKVIMKK